MGVFSDITLTMGGDDYVVPSDRVMGLIEAIEDHVVIFDLVNPQYLKNVQLCKAYHAALTYAGAVCTTEQVYDSLFNGGKEAVIHRITGLLEMMIPPKHLQASGEQLKKSEISTQN